MNSSWETNKIICELLAHQLGILPTFRAGDVNSLLKSSGLTPEQQRICKRKFRKAWRSAAKLTAKQYEKNSPGKKRRTLVAQLGLGIENQRVRHATKRSTIVHLMLMKKTAKHVKQFSKTLTEHEELMQCKALTK